MFSPSHTAKSIIRWRSYPSSVGYAATFPPSGEGSCYPPNLSICIHILGLSTSCGKTIASVYTLFDTQSKGLIEEYQLFNGVYFTYFTFLGTGLRFTHHNLPIYNVSYLAHGHSFWEQDCVSGSFMHSSQLVFTPNQPNINFAYRFPETYYQCCILGLDLDNLHATMPSWLKEMDVSLNHVKELFNSETPYAIQAPKEISSIFDAVLRVPQEYRFPYLRLKVQELLWELSRLDINIPRTSFKPIDKFELIRQTEKYLTDHVSTYVSVNKLSQIFPLDKTTIQTTFKSVYGKPIATYMKDYRLNLAKDMLLGGTEKVTAIAQQCGFSPSGFAATFKNATGLTPSEFRALHK